MPTPVFDPHDAVRRLVAMQRDLRDAVIASRTADSASLADVSHATAADTIYRIDALVEPLIDAHVRAWGDVTPLILIAEGLEGDDETKTYPQGLSQADAVIRVILDPIDGTRGIMYDKRPAWSLAGVAINRGPHTRLRDISAAVMTELPTSKMGFADVLSAVSGEKPDAWRVNLADDSTAPLTLRPSRATSIDHGFAQVSNFFPGTKELSARLMERIVAKLVGPADVTRATVFDDQYICTGGQWYELIVGHDRFNADLRPLFYAKQRQPEGLCCHPYDCVAWLIAEAAGVVLTDAQGEPLDGPLDTTTGLNWVGYANDALRANIEPVLRQAITTL